MSVEAKLSRLSLDLKNASSPKSSTISVDKLRNEPPDSWDDAAEDGDDVPEAPGPSLKQITSMDSPGPPPPTPISPQHTDPLGRKWDSNLVQNAERPQATYSSVPRDRDERRPEKTTSTANRLIAGALGLKAPKKTEEQKQYDRAVTEAEIKRKNKEKEQREQEKHEDEKVKTAVWDD